MKPAKKITVLLADDHQIVREGLRKILEAENDIDIVGEASSGRQAVEASRKFHPAVIVMDIAMPLLNGIEATRQIIEASPETRVLILSAHSDDAYIEKAMAMGASGFLIKQTSSDVLSDAIREIEKGNAFFSPSIAKKLRHQNQTATDRKGNRHTTEIRLTPREMEVLQLIAEGEANKQIAAELNISIKTVEKHRDHLMQKINIHDTAGLTRYAIETGIIECSVQMTII
ncbi:MAG: response regulator [Kiritimatiellales bacterium]